MFDFHHSYHYIMILFLPWFSIHCLQCLLLIIFETKTKKNSKRKKKNPDIKHYSPARISLITVFTCKLLNFKTSQYILGYLVWIICTAVFIYIFFWKEAFFLLYVFKSIIRIIRKHSLFKNNNFSLV